MTRFNRRIFIQHSGLILGGILSPLSLKSTDAPFDPETAVHKNQQIAKRDTLGELGIESIPNFCSHEHWGSLDSIGQAPEQSGFRCDTTAGAQPLQPASIWDLILDPYQGWWLSASGRDPHAGAKRAGYNVIQEWWKASPLDALNSYKEMVGSSMLTGGFQCTRKGILELYGTDIAKFELEDWKNLDAKIQAAYADIFSWYQQAMKKANFSELIRPVHPEFYVQEDTPRSKQKELSFTHTILRIDPFLDLWTDENPRREALSGIAGIEPVDAKSWREFISGIFDLAHKNKTTGIKQLQAYSRPLHFLPRKDTEVTFRGELNANEIICFQDWVMHECCKQANDRKWVHQVHVGTNNIAESGPLPLEALAKRYPDMNLVMIHCWPFLKEAGYLAKHVPNIYIDTCWMPVLNPAYLREALSMWMNYVPVHKIMLAHDSTSVEMATGSSLFTREILTEILLNQQNSLQISTTQLREFATDMLQNNAVRLYRIGEQFRL